MFSLFRNKKDLVTDISWLGVDIHSHLLPGIDDGAKDIHQSLNYITHLQNMGFEKLFCTPHIFTELYPNTQQTISGALEEVKGGLIAKNNQMYVNAAAEYMIDYSFQITDDLLCLPGRYILIEMSYLSETPNIEEVIFELKVKGYNVILAHPERYNFYHKNLPRYHRLKEMGCLFQLNLLSVVGYYGNEVRQAAEYLLGHEMYDLAGTDLHHDKHLDLLERSVKSGQLYELIGYYKFKNKQLFMVET